MSSSTLSSPPTPAPPNQWLARLCLDHVAHEQAQLDATLAALQDVRAALLGRDHAALGAALDRHQATAGLAEELRHRRTAFQREVGDHLGIPSESVTLELIVSHLPADAAAAVADARAGLRRTVAEVELLSNNNASLLYYCLDFLRRFFDRLTGRLPDGRYGPTGAPAAASGGSLINARG
jgi:hypothetical protein